MRVDKYIETPAILVVLVTGIWIWLYSTPTGTTFYAMLIAGLIAIVSNFHCIWLVFKRRDAAQAENWDEFDHLDDLQHKIGAMLIAAWCVR